MLGFARKSETHRQKCDIVRLVEEVLILTEKDLSKHRIHVEKRFEARPTAWAVLGGTIIVLTVALHTVRQNRLKEPFVVET
jgi:hypothetical protein